MKRTYMVEGHWPFPTDMLRKDQATPHAPIDRQMIDRMSGEASDPDLGMTKQKITLDMEGGETSRYFPHGRERPAYDRWESFGWRVIADPDLLDTQALSKAQRAAPVAPPALNELLSVVVIARKALTGTESNDVAVELIDNVLAYMGPSGMVHYPDSMLALFAGLLSLVELKYGNADPQVTALINAARRVLGRTPIPAREGAEA